MTSLLCMLLPLMAWSQTEEYRCGRDVVGRWFTDRHEGIVEIYIEDNICKGKIVWMDTDIPLKDTHNKNRDLRERPLLDLVIIDGLVWTGEKWDKGKVYDPDSGKSYDCLLWVAEGKLHLRGHVGAFGKTLKWDPAPEEKI